MKSKRKHRDERLRPTGTQKRRSNWARRLTAIEWTVALIATGVAVTLNLAFLVHAGALWRDEVNSVNSAAAPSLSEMWRLTEFESFPLAWTLLLRGWMEIGAGASDAGLRLFGVFGGLTIPAAIWFAARRLGRAVPLVSLALVAVNPEVTRWGASVRAWGVGTSLIIAAFVLMWDVLERPMRGQVLRATIAVVLSVQCVYQNGVLVAAVVAGWLAVALVRREWKRALVPLGIGALAAVSLLPYAALLRRRADWNALSQVPLTPTDVLTKGWEVIAASGTFVGLCWIAVVSTGLVWAIVRTRSVLRSSGTDTSRDLGIYAATVLIASIIGVGLFYLAFSFPTQPWYYIGLTGLVAVSAEAALGSALGGTIAGRTALTVSALCILTTGFSSARASMAERQTNLDVVATQLRTQAQPGDLVLVTPCFYGVTFGRYYTSGASVMTIPPLDDTRVHRYDLLKQKMLSADPIGPVLTRIRKVLESGGRVWLVGRLLAPAELTPTKLPPPPLPGTNWHSLPYEQTWSLQVVAFLKAHAQAIHPIPVTVKGGRFESGGISVIQGWHE